MNFSTKSTEELLKAGAGLILTVVGLIESIQKLSQVINNGNTTSFDITLVLLIILIAVGLWLLVDGLSKRSRLLIPEKLVIGIETGEHLVGRTQDVKDLINLCKQFHEVRLVGESGVGKTAVLRSGLIPALLNDSLIHPIYLDSWGKHWEAEPRLMLIAALVESLDEEQRRKLGIVSADEIDLYDVLLNFRQKLGRTPLLILDEFQDYTSLHRSKLFDSEKKTWIDSEMLVQENPFWNDIRNLVWKKAVRVLIATLSSETPSLRCVRFYAPEPYSLPRLEPMFVRQILTELTTAEDGEPPIVSDPQYGWINLKDKLTYDFAKEGTVLPVRIKAILYGLSNLSSLTVRSYNLAGGLYGLEVSFVERYVNHASTFSGLARSQVRFLLKSLIDYKGRVGEIKTLVKSTSDLTHLLSCEPNSAIESDELQSSVRNALESLAQHGILRQYVNSNEKDSLWGYYHDYFCRSVVEAERRANRWHTLLRERHQSFQELRRNSWWFWGKLLSPAEQVRLFYNRWRGQFNYGGYRPFAMLSLIRFVPYISLPIILFLIMDAGAALPGMEQARRIVDKYNLSLLRAPYSDTKIKSAAAQLRPKLLDEILRRKQKNHWLPGILLEEGKEEKPDPWSHSQTLALIYNTPEINQENYADFKNCFTVLANEKIDVDGVKFGWLNGVNPDITIAESTLWAGVALAQPLGQQKLRRQMAPDKIEEINNLRQFTQEAAKTYRPTNSGGWNIFPQQTNPSKHSIYTTALALFMLMETRDANLTWEGDHRDQLIIDTAAWLVDQYEDEVELPGWRGIVVSPIEEVGEPTADGLTLQIYAELLRLDMMNIGFRMPSKMLRQIPQHLEGINGRKSDYGISSTDYQQIEFKTHTGVIGKQKMNVKFLWYPWAIECAARFLEYAETHQEIPNEDKVIARRILGYLIVDLGEDVVSRYQKSETFKVTETLYALSSPFLTKDLDKSADK